MKGLRFFLYFFIASAFWGILAQLKLVDKFESNKVVFFVQSLLMVCSYIFIFELLEIMLAKKYQGIVTEALDTHTIYLFPKFLQIKVQYQLFLAEIGSEKKVILSRLTRQQGLNEGDFFRYYIASFFSTNNKIRVFDSKRIRISGLYLLIIVLLTILVKYLALLF